MDVGNRMIEEIKDELYPKLYNKINNELIDKVDITIFDFILNKVRGNVYRHINNTSIEL
jgi:hypothetical protein